MRNRGQENQNPTETTQAHEMITMNSIQAPDSKHTVAQSCHTDCTSLSWSWFGEELESEQKIHNEIRKSKESRNKYSLQMENM